MLGPPMSICSMTSSGVTPSRAAVCAERIEVHDDEIDRRDAVLGDRRHVLGQVAPREQAAVHRGVQRLHAAVEHLGELRDVADVAHRNAGLAQRARRAAGGDELPAELVQAAGEVEQAGLVGDGEKCARHQVVERCVRVVGDQRRSAGPSAASSRTASVTSSSVGSIVGSRGEVKRSLATRPSRVEAHLAAGDGVHDARIEQVLGAQHARGERVLVVAGEHGNGPLRDDRAVIVHLVDEVHRRPATARTGLRSRRDARVRRTCPRRRTSGSSAGCTLSIRPRYARVTSAGTSRM